MVSSMDRSTVNDYSVRQGVDGARCQIRPETGYSKLAISSSASAKEQQWRLQSLQVQTAQFCQEVFVSHADSFVMVISTCLSHSCTVIQSCPRVCFSWPDRFLSEIGGSVEKLVGRVGPTRPATASLSTDSPISHKSSDLIHVTVIVKYPKKI